MASGNMVLSEIADDNGVESTTNKTPRYFLPRCPPHDARRDTLEDENGVSSSTPGEVDVEINEMDDDEYEIEYQESDPPNTNEDSGHGELAIISVFSIKEDEDDDIECIRNDYAKYEPMQS